MAYQIVWKDFDPETGIGDPSTPLSAQGLNNMTTNLITEMDERILDSLEPSVWVTPALSNSWVAYSATEPPAAYRIMPDNTVRLRGSIKSGATGVAIFTLPAAYRPSAPTREVFVTIGGAGLCEIDVGADGVVKVAQYLSGGSNAFVSLAGITFSID